jgi:hypothetical protein
VHAALETVVELSLAPSTSQNLRLDDQLVLALLEVSRTLHRHASERPTKILCYIESLLGSLGRNALWCRYPVLFSTA